MAKDKALLSLIMLINLSHYGCSDSKFKGQNNREKDLPGDPPLTEATKNHDPSPSPGAGEDKPKEFVEGSPIERHEFKQADYPSITLERTQGKKGTLVTGAFDQGSYGALDLLVVVDNSGSMAEEQKNLAPKLSSLVSQVGRADWRIAVTTTDPDDPCLLGVIAKGDSGAEAAFNQIIIGIGTKGTGLERPFLRAAQALACPGMPDWMRPGSKLAILIVSDEDNCHNDAATGYQCATEDKSAEYLLTSVSKLRGLGTDARIYGIISEPQAPCSSALKTGTLIAQAVAASGGILGDICAQDYSGVLSEISNHVSQILQQDLTLDRVPSPGTLALEVNGVPWDRYQLEGQRIKFTEPPPFGSKVQVTYRYGVEGVFTDTVNLEKPPVDDTLSVVLENQVLPGDRYVFDSSTATIQFKEAPPEGAVVRVSYRGKAPLGELFFVGSGEIVPDSLKVTVDDQPHGGVAFDPTSGEVKISPPPAPQAKVVVTLKRLKS